MNDAVKKTNGKIWLAFLSIALLMGIILRLSFPNDIEYKSDEKYTFEASQNVGITEPWPLLGMSSGVGVKNPGMSVWVFVVLSRIVHASTPPELARAVQLLNILSLFLLAFFSLCILPSPEKLSWCWATAFAAVNPFAILFHRKIWAQCTLPFFCVLMWISWHYRHKRTGAFFWGLLGACLGQIHMSGFFLAAGVFLWTAIHDRKVRWGSWFLGSLIGAVPLIPWLQYMASNPGNGFNPKNFLFILYPQYWIYWVTDSLGLGLNYSIKTHQLLDFLRYPLINGMGTYLVGICHAVIIVAGISIFVSAVKAKGFFRGIRDSSETGLALNSGLFAFGALLTLSCVKICRHYLIVSFPLEWVWLSRMAHDNHRGQKQLALIWMAQLIVSAAFLVYIHVNHGAPMADYGTAYQFQTQ
jgi:hypothetical protein